MEDVTKYSEVYEAFLDRIYQDDTFFVADEEIEKVKELTEKKLKKLMDIGLYRLMLSDGKRDFQVNFLEHMDDENDTFTIELSLVEIQLIADLMFEVYVNENFIVRIKELRKVGFQDSEIKLFIHSPANSLKEFNASYESLRQENKDKIYNYKQRDRKSLKYIPFNFSL